MKLNKGGGIAGRWLLNYEGTEEASKEGRKGGRKESLGSKGVNPYDSFLPPFLVSFRGSFIIQ